MAVLTFPKTPIDDVLRVRPGSSLEKMIGPRRFENSLRVDNSTHAIPIAYSVLDRGPSRELEAFHKILGDEFGANELELREIFERELKEGRCFGVVVNDPLTDPRGEHNHLVSGAYGSIHTNKDPGETFCAIRFTLTEARLRRNPFHPKNLLKRSTYRGSNISQFADDRFIWIADRMARKSGSVLTELLCEAVRRSEGFWNGIRISKEGQGMKSIFLPNGRELKYVIDSLGWGPDGEKLVPSVREHLMVTGGERMYSESLAWKISELTKSWYLRPRSEFSRMGYNKHYSSVMRRLDRNIDPILKGSYVNLFTKEERHEQRLLRYDERILLC